MRGEQFRCKEDDQIGNTQWHNREDLAAAFVFARVGGCRPVVRRLSLVDPSRTRPLSMGGLGGWTTRPRTPHAAPAKDMNSLPAYYQSSYYNPPGIPLWEMGWRSEVMGKDESKPADLNLSKLG